MQWRRWLGVIVVGGGLCAGCHQPEISPASSLTEPPAPTTAQPRLPTIKLWLGANEMVAEVARTPVQLQTGMMFRQQMAENEGMLFVFPQPHRTAFYMRNTVIPLSAAYLDSEGTVLEIHPLKPLDETPVEAASDQVRFVLETPQGWFDRHQIGVGAAVRCERGSLAETFFGQ